tara:strand:+ start:97 stop:402 length:306 start_codon:yes stop_codon:yes gene_type:complete
MQYHPSHYKAENYQELVQAVKQEWQPYIKSDGEILLSSAVAQLVIKNNILVSEYEELKKGYFDLCKANDEMKRTLLDIATEQKRINKLYSTKINKIQKKLP